MKIAICASEVVPFAKTGGLADVAGALPLALEKKGVEVVVVMPAYACVKKAKKAKFKKVLADVSCAFIGKKIPVYFIEKEEYFDRDNLYTTKTGDYPDNLDRFSYFSKRALSVLKEIGFQADCVHCHDWQTALIPVYLKTICAGDPFFQHMKSVFTIHNIGYQGLFLKEEFPKTGLDWNLFSMETLEFFNKVNILKGGIVFSDVINTVSPTYSREIQTKEFGFGLEGVLQKRRDSLFGILNGLDYDIWNPATDEYIAKRYSADKAEEKSRNKAYLQKTCGLPVKDTTPLVGIVSRLAQQKGFDIIAEAIDDMCRMDIQLVILGAGDAKYQQVLEQMMKKYPKIISLNLGFNDPLAHAIYAGSDLFLMPSHYEPCGLGQMISFRYGTIPLVFRTGGLADTVTEDNGFIFDEYSKEALVSTIKKAVVLFKDKKKWPRIVRNAMNENFSWDIAAEKYRDLYNKVHSL
ncbi:MAG: glycogen synthase GlgA [Candidatus Omnitrophica bacterium]|nr:glycogen synthase GlgA [Candidatus Omnitrophota bacterium]